MFLRFEARYNCYRRRMRLCILHCVAIKVHRLLWGVKRGLLAAINWTSMFCSLRLAFLLFVTCQWSENSAWGELLYSCLYRQHSCILCLSAYGVIGMASCCQMAVQWTHHWTSMCYCLLASFSIIIPSTVSACPCPLSSHVKSLAVFYLFFAICGFTWRIVGTRLAHSITLNSLAT